MHLFKLRTCSILDVTQTGPTWKDTEVFWVGNIIIMIAVGGLKNRNISSTNN